MYFDATIDCMQITLNIDEKLLAKAKEACGTASSSETVRRALQALVQANAYEQLAGLLGSEPDAEDVPRRREEPGPEHKVA